MTTRQEPCTPLGPLVWPVVMKVPPKVRTFAGHSNTVPDIVGRFGMPASLVIFTEGNHLMVLHSEDMLGAFPIWAKSQSKYPDIVMGGPAPLQTLCKIGVIEPLVRTFAKNRGRALIVRNGNPLGIKSLADVARTGARLAQADTVEAAARAGNIAAVEALVGKSVADAVFAHELGQFPGRLGITHRDVPEALARGYADVGLTQYHLISYWVRTFPNHFELVPITGAERFSLKIGFARGIDPS